MQPASMRELGMTSVFLNWESKKPPAAGLEDTVHLYKLIPVCAGGPTYGQVVQPADIAAILEQAEAKGYLPEIDIKDVPAIAIIRSVRRTPGLTYETLAAGSEGKGDPVIDRIREIAQRLAADPEYRSEMERELGKLMKE